jgi:hypothetical protein
MEPNAIWVCGSPGALVLGQTLAVRHAPGTDTLLASLFRGRCTRVLGFSSLSGLDRTRNLSLCDECDHFRKIKSRRAVSVFFGNRF